MCKKEGLRWEQLLGVGLRGFSGSQGQEQCLYVFYTPAMKGKKLNKKIKIK
jgi:hypothetical protein